MAISKERKKYIESLANELWADDSNDEDFDELSERMGQETIKFCTQTNNPEELQIFVDHYNWDIGIHHMRQVIENLYCDAGTALMVYWRAEPEYFLQYADRSEVPTYSHENFDLLCEIERRYLSGEYKTKLCEYDPKSDVGCNEGMKEKDNRSIPKEMYKPVVLQ